MHLDSPDNIPSLINSTGFSIFFFDRVEDFPNIKRAITISPNEKGSISIEQVRDIIVRTITKHQSSAVFIVESADKLTESASNALLKLLEQPAHNIHIAFFICSHVPLLPTIRSRAQIYHLSQPVDLSVLTNTDTKTISQAKTLISASNRDLITLATTLAKDRTQAISVVNTAIEILEKTYLKTANPRFVRDLKKLINLHSSLSQNGHIKLHIIADML